MTNFFESDDEFDDPLADIPPPKPETPPPEEVVVEEIEPVREAVMPPVETSFGISGIEEPRKVDPPVTTPKVAEESEESEEEEEHEHVDEGSFKFKVSDPSKSIHGKSYTFWVYQITTQTRLENYKRSHLNVKRRYSDFVWIREQLVCSNPGCIVPPIPEKSFIGSLEKYVTSINSQALVQYRMRALTKFLTRVGEHQVLKFSENLKLFLELSFEEFQKIRYSHKPQKNPSTFLKKRITKVPEWIYAHRAFGKKLTKSLANLKNAVQDQVKKRRVVASSFSVFGRSFTSLGDTERSYEESHLSKALRMVGEQAEYVKQEMDNQADKETMQVVETLTYYMGMCAAIDQCTKDLEDVRLIRDDVTEIYKRKSLALEHNKLTLASSHPKLVNQANEVVHLKERQTEANKILFHAEKNFKNDLEKFDLERRIDFGYMLHAFISVQIKYHKIASNSWEKVVPTIKLITSGE